MPWLSKNSTRKRAGNVHICAGSADHTAAAWGTISLSTKAGLKRSSRSHCASDGSASEASSARAARLKRTYSPTIRWKRGSTRWRGLAYSAAGECAAYSKSAPSETPKLMSDGWVATPSSASSA